MSVRLILVLVIYSLGMACGQILFKFASQSVQRDVSTSPLLAYVNVYFIAGIALYFSLTILWVWLLKFVPLSTAYPFVALAFIFTPVLSLIFFGEKVSIGYFLGLAFIACGVIIIAKQ